MNLSPIGARIFSLLTEERAAWVKSDLTSSIEHPCGLSLSTFCDRVLIYAVGDVRRDVLTFDDEIALAPIIKELVQSLRASKIESDIEIVQEVLGITPTTPGS